MSRPRYSIAELRFIAARVIAEVRATPPQGPVFAEPRARKLVCKRGHARPGPGHCPVCERDRKRAARRAAR